MRRPRHAFLRNITAEAHEKLELAMEAAGFFNSLPAYGSYLRRLRLFHKTFEDCFTGPRLALLQNWRIRDHAAWLDEDIAALDLSPLPGNTAYQLRRPQLQDHTSALGALYVMLGATLGSRLLVKQLEALHLPPGKGRTYLTSLSGSSDWPAFLTALEEDAGICEAALGQGAVSTFESVLDHMAGAYVT
jgi:heme oxygenase